MPATLRFNTQVIPDNIVVSYEGKAVTNTTCFGTAGTSAGCISQGIFAGCCYGDGWCEQRFRYGPGSSTILNVDITLNCAGTPDTAWGFSISCPSKG
jgi:hypothetical protein